MHWKAHIKPQQIYQWVNWSCANNARILDQKWRKGHVIYGGGYAHAERQDASQQAVLAYLQHGTVHPSPNFAIWFDYWCWWAVLMEYAYNAHFLDALGDNSTFNRLAKLLRIARDELLGVETEAYPVQPLDTPTGAPGLEFFDDDYEGQVA